MNPQKKTNEILLAEVKTLRERVAELEAQVEQFRLTEVEHTQTEQTLRSSEKNLSAIIKASPLAMISIDPHGMVLSWNHAAERIFGWTEAEVLGKRLPIIADDQEEGFAALLKSYQEEQTPSQVNVKRVRKDNTIISVSLSPAIIRDDQGEVSAIIGILDDITEQKIAEEKLQRLKDNLEISAAQKTQSIDTLEETIAARTADLQKNVHKLDRNEQAMLYMIEDLNETTVKLETERQKLALSNQELEAFSYSVSHDLRAPLRHINGYIDLLMKRFPDTLDEKSQHYLDSIVESANEMSMLIDSLLQFSKTSRQEMHFTIVDMNNLVQEVLINLKPDNDDRKIEWKINPLPEVTGDRYLLKLVWLNLLTNAIKFTQQKAQARVEVGFNEAQDEFIFFVRDNGVGFDMKYSQKLFSVFQRLHNSAEYEGTGIGLANLRRIILRHDGLTWAEGKPGKGAVFYFSLPKTEN